MPFNGLCNLFPAFALRYLSSLPLPQFNSYLRNKLIFLNHTAAHQINSFSFSFLPVSPELLIALRKKYWRYKFAGRWINLLPSLFPGASFCFVRLVAVFMECSNDVFGRLIYWQRTGLNKNGLISAKKEGKEGLHLERKFPLLLPFLYIEESRRGKNTANGWI